MKDATGREMQEFWTVSGSEVLKVVGYSCGPENPDYWWVPKIGYSMMVNIHLFHSAREAVEAAILENECEIAKKQKAIKRLTAKLKTP